MAPSLPASVKKTLFTEGFLQDPYPTYERLRGEGRIQMMDWGPGMWVAFHYSDCVAVLKSPQLSARRTGAMLRPLPAETHREFADLVRMMGLWMLFMDAPEHSRLRKLMNKGFSAAALDSLRPQIQAIVDELVAPLSHASEIEIMRSFAHPLPVRVIAHMLGARGSMQQHLLGCSDAIATFIGTAHRTIEHTRAAQAAVRSLTDFFSSVIAERRRAKGGDLISLLLEIEEDGDVLTEEELYAQCVMLLFAGHETTRNLIGNGLFALLRHPQQLAQLREDPALIRSAVEELLRFESPVQHTSRIVKEELDFCGIRLQPGEVVVALLGSANRDGQQFKNPAQLNLARLNNSHLALGGGAHFCIGGQLARLEGQLAILRLIQTFPKMQLTGQQPQWIPNFALRGLQSLPVSV